MLTEIAAGVVAILWVALASRGWRYVLSIAGLFLLLAVVRGRLLRNYERTGEAVPIPRPTGVVFTSGTPTTIRVLRRAFFAVVTVLLFFGLAPLPNPIAKTGMIVSVVGMFAVGGFHFFLERHYVNTGRAEERYDGPSGA